MTNIDYVAINGPTTADELLGVLAAAFPARETDTSKPGGTRIVLDPTTVLDVQFDITDDPAGLVGVHSSAGEGPAVARRVYDELVARTSWSLQLSSDDTGDDVLVYRPATAQRS